MEGRQSWREAAASAQLLRRVPEAKRRSRSACDPEAKMMKVAKSMTEGPAIERMLMNVSVMCVFAPPSRLEGWHLLECLKCRAP